MASLTEVFEKSSLNFSIDSYKLEPNHKIKKIIDEYWSIAFLEMYLTSSASSCERDDLVFYIQYDSKTKTDSVIVLRKDSKAHPERLDRTILWDETLYMNLLQHEFKYHLTCCTLKAASSSVPLSNKIINKVTMDIYPSHLERRMDKKEKESTTICYPNLRFYVDNFDEVFSELVLNEPGDKIAVQILAINSLLSIRKPIFIGGLDFKVLKRVYEQKEKEKQSQQSIFSSLSRRKSSSYTRIRHNFHFLPMDGPDGKGHAEMAISTSLTSPSHKELDKGSETVDKPSETRDKGSETHDEESEIIDKGPGTVDKGSETVSGGSEEVDSLNDTSSNGINESPQRIFCSTEKLIDSPDTVSSASLSSPAATATSKDFLKSKHSSKKHKDKKYSPQEEGGRYSISIHTYLTYVELPWYTIMEDILRSKKEPIL